MPNQVHVELQPSLLKHFLRDLRRERILGNRFQTIFTQEQCIRFTFETIGSDRLQIPVNHGAGLRREDELQALLVFDLLLLEGQQIALTVTDQVLIELDLAKIAIANGSHDRNLESKRHIRSRVSLIDRQFAAFNFAL